MWPNKSEKDETFQTLVAVGGEKENKGRFVEKVEFNASEQVKDC